METTVLIVSKTKMNNGICVGGINEGTCELIRLHNDHGGNLSSEAPYEIGDRWEIQVENAWNVRKKPHVEDKQTKPLRKINNIGTQGIISFVNSHFFGNKITKGNIDQTFEGCLNLCGKQNFVNEEKIPSFSTQFWIADIDLIHFEQCLKHYYLYNSIRIKFVGCQSPIEKIPAGTIIRLSLANWWDRDGNDESRCYLQLSGWYL